MSYIVQRGNAKVLQEIGHETQPVLCVIVQGGVQLSQGMPEKLADGCRTSQSKGQTQNAGVLIFGTVFRLRNDVS